MMRMRLTPLSLAFAFSILPTFENPHVNYGYQIEFFETPDEKIIASNLTERATRAESVVIAAPDNIGECREIQTFWSPTE